MRRPGLRAKLATAFAVGALLISGAVATLSYDLTRNNLLDSRQRSAVRNAYLDATIVNAGLSGSDPDVVDVLRSLDTGSGRHPLIWRDNRWYARGADAGFTNAIPDGLQTMVSSGSPAIELVSTTGGPAFAIGIPLTNGSAFYMLDSQMELDQTLRVLALILALVAAGTTAAGASLGIYAGRRVLRPLGRITDAARNIRAGDLTARLDAGTEPDLQQLAAAFNGMVDQLAERIVRDRRFAADVSHELRSPLQTLAAAVSVLDRRRDRLDERSATAVSLISDEVSRFGDLVTDLLELARSDRPVERVDVDVADLAVRACREHGLPASLVELIDGTPAQWRVEELRVAQILANLLDNAQRYGGGALAVRLYALPQGIGRIEVDDEGPGVMPSDRVTIFHRFVRGSAAAARGQTDGTGLGLALIAAHAAAHDGTARVVERPGGGARFQVDLRGATCDA